MNAKRQFRTALAWMAVSGTLATALPAQRNPGFVAREDGAWLHYLEVGRENPGPLSLLFIPGWTMPDWIWNPQLEAFGKELRAIAMSPRSHGQSSKENDGHYPYALAGDIKSVIDQLDLMPVVLVGWSLGVSQAVAFIDRYGTSDLAGLVLIDGVAGQDPALPSPQWQALMASMQRNRPAFSRDFVRSMFRSDRNPDYLNQLAQASLATPTNSALALLTGAQTFDLRESLGKIDVPTLIAVAGNEQNPNWASYLAMKEAIPGARLEAFPEAGHALFIDESDRFNQLLREFLGQIANSGR